VTVVEGCRGSGVGEGTAASDVRLDVELVRRGLARSRGQARELIVGGDVQVNGQPQKKPSLTVRPDSDITLSAEPERWVGRAAYKLLGALAAFGPRGLAVAGRRCLDVGASTGGFTQVLLEAGATHVTALDVGHGQLAPSIADDPRVEERSATNIRGIRPESVGGAFDVLVADLSFVSLRLTLPSMAALLRPDGDLVVLVKPQFEVGRDRVGRTGVVTSWVEHARVLRDLTQQATSASLGVLGLIPSPLRGGEGNREYLLWMTSRPGEGLEPGAVEALIEQVKGRP